MWKHLLLKPFINALFYTDFSIQLKQLETQYNKQFDDVFEAINYLVKKDNQLKQQVERKKIGFNNKD